MSHARIEEVSESESGSSGSDPSEGDISDVGSDFDEREILKQRTVPGPRPSQVQPPTGALINPSNIPSTSSNKARITTASDGTQFHTTEDDSKYKNFQCIYPIYFDANRSRAEGRRVGIEYAVESPLAREIVAACGLLQLETLFEPAKTHPKDWANPGRVKIKIKGGHNPSVKNSMCSLDLYLRVNMTVYTDAVP